MRTLCEFVLRFRPDAAILQLRVRYGSGSRGFPVAAFRAVYLARRSERKLHPARKILLFNNSTGANNMHTEIVSLEAATETNASESSESIVPVGPMPKAKKGPRKVGKAKAKAEAKAAAPKIEAKAPSKNQVPLKAILQELKLDGKLARRKLRAAKLDFHAHRERWFFTAKQAAKIREILTK
jgi:hypothetical protein